MWPDAYIDVNGIRVHYHRSGGDKPPVVLAHGFSDNGLCWTPVAAVLAADYDVILYDARGHGLSSGPESGYSDEHHAADLAALIEGLALDRPVVIGHSMGARTAAMTAGLYPGLVRAAVLEDPPWFAGWSDQADVAKWLNEHDPNEPMDNPLQQWILDLRRLDVDMLEQKQRVDAPGWPDGEYAPWAESKHQFNLAVFDALRQPDAPLSPPWKATVHPLACPTLLVIGDANQGALVTAELAAEISRYNPQVRVLHIPGAGHSIRRDQYSAFTEGVQAFLAEVLA